MEPVPLGKDSLTHKFLALLNLSHSINSKGESDSSWREAEGKAQSSSLRLKRHVVLRQRVVRQSAAGNGLISPGRKWDANWSAPAYPRDLHSTLLIRWPLESNFFGGRLLLLITFSYQQEGYCSEFPSLGQSWLSSQLWSEQSPLMSECQLFSFYPSNAFFSLQTDPVLETSWLITNSQLDTTLY